MPRIYAGPLNTVYTLGYYQEVSEFEFNRTMEHFQGYWVATNPLEHSPQPANPSSEGSWIVSDSPSPAPPPIPPYQRTRGLEVQVNTYGEIEQRTINWIPATATRHVDTLSARSGTQEGGATASPALRQTLKRDGNTFKKFIQKTMNTESS